VPGIGPRRAVGPTRTRPHRCRHPCTRRTRIPIGRIVWPLDTSTVSTTRATVNVPRGGAPLAPGTSARAVPATANRRRPRPTAVDPSPALRRSALAVCICTVLFFHRPSIRATKTGRRRAGGWDAASTTFDPAGAGRGAAGASRAAAVQAVGVLLLVRSGFGVPSPARCSAPVARSPERVGTKSARTGYSDADPHRRRRE
jgi:hypothetical protein